MAKAVDLCSDFNGLELRRLARRTKDSAKARRLLALAEVYDGGPRSEAARIGGVTLQSIRDWVLRFNAQGPEGLIDPHATGRSSHDTPTHRCGWPRCAAVRGRLSRRNDRDGARSPAWNGPVP